jgi:putative iron-sulfur cluster binding protein (fragment)
MLGSASGTSAGFVSSDATDRGTEGTSTPARGKLPEVRDVAVMLLEAVKRGQ